MPARRRPDPGRSRSGHTDRLTADGVVTRYGTAEQGRRLAAELLDRGRTVPVVAVTVHPDAAGPYLDADVIARELESAAAVVELSADATFGLTDGLRDRRLSVFYGAGRVYPVGSEWTHAFHKSPLHMCFSKARAERVQRAVIEDALTAAHAAGVLSPGERQAEDVRAVVTVKGPFGALHAHVEAPDGRQAVMLTAALWPGEPNDRVVRRGQSLGGVLRPRGLMAEFLPDQVSDDALVRARAAFPDGSHTLARVDDVAAQTATLLLHPKVPTRLVADGDEDLSLILTPGDTVCVEVVWEGDQALTALIPDPDPERLPASMSLLPEGPPWLLPEDLEPEAVPVPSAPEEAGLAPGDVAPDAHPQIHPEGSDGSAQSALVAELESAHADIDRLRSELREVRRANRKKQAPPGRVWRDPEWQLRHEIYHAWLHRIPEDDRKQWPRPATYVVADGFVESVQKLQGIRRDKILDVIVEVLTGLAKDLKGRRVHAWLDSHGGEQQVRADGAKAYRVNLQTNSPGARRLKYWQLPNNSIELDSVGVHDDGLR